MLLMWKHAKDTLMRRRHLLALAGSAGLSGIAGCSALGGVSGGCPDNPIADTSIPPDRRTIEFLAEENQPVKPSEDPIIEFEPTNARVVITGVFSGATPKRIHEKDMILVTRLRYDEQSDTLQVRLVERQCRSGGGSAGGEVAPYVLRVQFTESLPQRVCVEERGGIDKDVCVSR